MPVASSASGPTGQMTCMPHRCSDSKSCNTSAGCTSSVSAPWHREELCRHCCKPGLCSRKPSKFRWLSKYCCPLLLCWAPLLLPCQNLKRFLPGEWRPPAGCRWPSVQVCTKVKGGASLLPQDLPASRLSLATTLPCTAARRGVFHSPSMAGESTASFALRLRPLLPPLAS